MTFGKINRRTHLYLGLFLLPWLAMYGVSSFDHHSPSLAKLARAASAGNFVYEKLHAA